MACASVIFERWIIQHDAEHGLHRRLWRLHMLACPTRAALKCRLSTCFFINH